MSKRTRHQVEREIWSLERWFEDGGSGDPEEDQTEGGILKNLRKELEALGRPMTAHEREMAC